MRIGRIRIHAPFLMRPPIPFERESLGDSFVTRGRRRDDLARKPTPSAARPPLRSEPFGSSTTLYLDSALRNASICRRSVALSFSGLSSECPAGAFAARS